MSVLVLGASGMLGSTVVHRLRTTQPEWGVEGVGHGTDGRLMFDAEAGRPALEDLLRLGRYDYIINCIGVLKTAIDERVAEQLERAIRVNGLFPHEAAAVAAGHSSRVIHVSTDAVFSGRLLRPYTVKDPPDPVDVYGMTKALGESPAGNVLNIRCSIVGRDRRCRGLIEWYRGATSPSVTGFVDYVWTPVTTVQVADFCAALVRGDFDRCRVNGHVLHFAPNDPLSKATFLEYLREALGGGPSIEASPGPGGPCHRVLASDDEKARWPQPRDWPGLFSDVFAEFSLRGV